MKLSFINSSQKSIPRKHLNEVAKKLSKYLANMGFKEQMKKEIVMVFVEAQAMRDLNQQFRGKNYPTDVLSFESGDPEALGELVFCPSVLAEQANEQHHAYRWELTYMFIHGVLHLLGYEHEGSKTKAEEMFRLQDRFFSTLT